jgi:hypothetical protein
MFLGWREEGVEVPVPEHVTDEVGERVALRVAVVWCRRVGLGLVGALEHLLLPHVEQHVWARQRNLHLVDAERARVGQHADLLGEPEALLVQHCLGVGRVLRDEVAHAWDEDDDRRGACVVQAREAS